MSAGSLPADRMVYLLRNFVRSLFDSSYEQAKQTWYKRPMSPRSGLHDLVLPFNAESLACCPCVDLSYLKLLRMPQGPSLIKPPHSTL